MCEVSHCYKLVQKGGDTYDKCTFKNRRRYFRLQEGSLSKGHDVHAFPGPLGTMY